MSGHHHTHAGCADTREGPHDHHDHHDHAPRDFGRAFAIGTLLNLGFVGVEATSGVMANSMALLADAGHNLGDVLGLLIAWVANEAQKRAPTKRFTYGLTASPILASLANAMLLLIAVGAIAVEAIRQIISPAEVASHMVIGVALVGIVVNSATAYLFMGGRDDDINARGAYLHMAADAAVSLGVVIAGLLILLTGKTWIDPAVSLVIAAVIVWGTWDLLKDSTRLALHAVPPAIDPDAVRGSLEKLPGVTSVHDLHIWPLGTRDTALTCHLVMPQGCPGDAFIAEVSEQLEHSFGIGHATFQIERGDGGPCKLEPEHVI